MTLSKAPAMVCSVPPSPLTCLDPYSGLLTAFLVAILTSFTSLPTLQPQSSFQHGNQLWLLLCLKASNGFPMGLGVKFQLLAPGNKGLPDFLAHLPSPASVASRPMTFPASQPVPLRYPPPGMLFLQILGLAASPSSLPQGGPLYPESHLLPRALFLTSPSILFFSVSLKWTFQEVRDLVLTAVCPAYSRCSTDCELKKLELASPSPNIGSLSPGGKHPPPFRLKQVPAGSQRKGDGERKEQVVSHT